MLSDLKINNIAIIKEAAISFDGGLNVLTGETGAGKSIIIDAINAIIGERTSRELIRTDSDSAEVSALFQNISDSVSYVLDDLQIEKESDRSLLITRKILSDGRNICRINGSSATVSMLKKIGQSLINVHGQLDNHNLLNEEIHYTYIDSFAENGLIREKYSKAYNAYLEAENKLRDVTVDESEKARKTDLLEYQINEIESAKVRTGEIAELENRRRVLSNLENLTELISSSVKAINGDDGFKGASQLISFVADNLNKAAQFDESLSELASSLTDISYTVADCASELNSFLYGIDADPNELDSVEERLDTYYRLGKKYGKTEEEILEFLERAKNELNAVAFSDELRLKYEKELEAAKAELAAAGAELTENRRLYSREFISAVSEELRFLDMSSITFEVVCNKKEYDATGGDEIYFLISANKGEAPKPLSKIASGGELSRIMLAIKNVLAAKDDIETLIFDEVDTGVSGRAAQKIGIKLKEVSKNRQVLCVTHLAQIAAYADSHFLISKSEISDKTYTKVELLDMNGRVNELARIMGGMEPGSKSIDAAAELIETAQKNS